MFFSSEREFKKVKTIVKEWDDNDLCFYYHYSVNEYMVMNKQEIYRFLRENKVRLQKGQVYILLENNRDCRIQGKEFYSLTIQSPLIQNMDVISSMCLDDESFWITGHSYFFTKKANRDSVYTYLSKFCHLKLYEDNDDVECGVCLDDSRVLFKTTCCGQFLCHQCNEKMNSNVCAFCRHNF